MEYWTDNSYLNIRTNLALEDDRHILAEEQKACRARARKCSLETNQRRKALEERKKAMDMREQTLREEILQQRRQRQQDATERYQRAHLPPSQRKRPAFSRANNLDEALKKIQGTLSSYAVQSPYYSGRSRTNRSYLSSPNSSAVSNQLRHKRQVSAAVAYAKLLQETNDNNLKNSQLLFPNDLREIECLLEERQVNSKQEFQQEVSRPGQTESLSSLDSSDSADSQHASGTSAGCTSSTLHHSDLCTCTGSQSLRKNFNGVYPRSEMTSCRREIVCDLWTHQKGASLSPQPTVPSRKENPGDNGQPQHKIIQPRGEVNTEDQTPVTAAPSTLSDQSMSAHSRTADNLAHPIYCGKPNQQNSLCDKGPIAVACRAWASPVETCTEKAGLVQGVKLDARQQRRNIIDKCPNYASDTQIALPTNDCNSDTFSGHTFQKPGSLQNAINQTTAVSESAFTTPTEPWNTSYLHKSQLNVNTSTSCNEHANCEIKDERSRILDPSNNTGYNCDHIEENISQCSQSPDETTQTTPMIPASISVFSSSETKLIKGILKKQSKFLSDSTTPIPTSGSASFTKQESISIRDSVEPATLTEKEPESSKTMKKKLRWFDEGDEEDRRGFQKLNKRGKGQGRTGLGHPSQLRQLSTDHQKDPLYSKHLVADSTRTSQAAQVTRITSTGYHFAKQAWADMKGQDGKLQERGGEHRVEITSPHRGGPRASRRASSARVGQGPDSKSGKGALIRPQSAIEGSRVARPQGEG